MVILCGYRIVKLTGVRDKKVAFLKIERIAVVHAQILFRNTDLSGVKNPKGLDLRVTFIKLTQSCINPTHGNFTG
jgi:hypothetical protein